MAKSQSSLADDDFIRRIHSGRTQFVLAATGGASGAIAALLTVPGASHSVLEATAPYSEAALVAWLGSRPEQFCDEHTARLIAMAAYERATKYAQSAESKGVLAGIGCTASLASDRPKRGAHRIHAAAQTAQFTAVASLELTKGARDRRQEEAVAARIVLNLVAQACRVADRLPLELLASEQLVEECTEAPRAWQELFAGRTSAALADESRAPPAVAQSQETAAGSGTAAPMRRVIFPGAFHPLHDGHRRMAERAAARLGQRVEWEISITNVDKPPLDYHELRLRGRQFAADMPLWFTRAPTFVEKAKIFSGATFVVGADTISRIADSRYYHNDPQGCQDAIAAIAAAGCRFLVFGRQTVQGFETLSDLSLPGELRAICDEVPASDFRADITSTELRRADTDTGAAGG